jgi:hypothetical protein
VSDQRRRAAKAARRRKRGRGQGRAANHGHGVVVVGERGPIVRIDNDEGALSLFHADAPDRTLTADDCYLACLHCMTARWPEVSAGLSLAKQHRVVLFDGGSWRPGNPD